MSQHSISRSAAAALVMASTAFGGCLIDMTPVMECWVDGRAYAPGYQFPAADGCNTCTCLDDGNVACTTLGCVSTCTYDAQEYMAGDTFPSTDGCNTCACGADGLVACTEVACVVCMYAGESYSPEESFPALDGCNTCVCAADGSISCTEMACPCNAAREWWRDYVSMDPAACETLDDACPPTTTAFDNACGCGCEQEASCSEAFDCMPPARCDVESIMTRCPYSQIAY